MLLSVEQYSLLTDNVEKELDLADRLAAEDKMRYSFDEVFDRVRGKIDGERDL